MCRSYRSILMGASERARARASVQSLSDRTALLLCADKHVREIYLLL